MLNCQCMYGAGLVRHMRRMDEPREVEADRAFVAVCGNSLRWWEIRPPGMPKKLSCRA